MDVQGPGHWLGRTPAPWSTKATATARGTGRMDGQCACDCGCAVLSHRHKGRVMSTPRKLTPSKEGAAGRCRVRVNVALDGEGLAPRKLELPLHKDRLRCVSVGQAAIRAAAKRTRMRMTRAYLQPIISFLETRQPAVPPDEPGTSLARTAQYIRMPAWSRAHRPVHVHPVCACARIRMSARIRTHGQSSQEDLGANSR